MAKTSFLNILQGYLQSQPIFWLKGKKDNPAMNIGEILDVHDNLRGVDCKGRLNGIQFQTNEVGDDTGLLTMTLETLSGVTQLVFRNCSDTIVYSVASGIDPQAVNQLYRAVLAQTGVGAPTATVATETLLGVAPVPSYVGVGIYRLTSAGSFTLNKTFVNLDVLVGATGFKAEWVRISADVIELRIFDAANVAVDLEGSLQIEIVVLP